MLLPLHLNLTNPIRSGNLGGGNAGQISGSSTASILSDNRLEEIREDDEEVLLIVKTFLRCQK